MAKTTAKARSTETKAQPAHHAHGLGRGLGALLGDRAVVPAKPSKTAFEEKRSSDAAKKAAEEKARKDAEALKAAETAKKNAEAAKKAAEEKARKDAEALKAAETAKKNAEAAKKAAEEKARKDAEALKAAETAKKNAEAAKKAAEEKARKDAEALKAAETAKKNAEAAKKAAEEKARKDAEALKAAEMAKKDAEAAKKAAEEKALKDAETLKTQLAEAEEARKAAEAAKVAAEEAAAAAEATGASAGAVMNVPVAEIARCPWQPRVTFDKEALAELTESIKAHGVIQPLICRKLAASAGGGYELIAGERRLRAAIDAGLTKVPVVITEAVDRDAAEMAIIENIQREDLNVIEEAEGYRTLAEGFGLTQQEVADRVGKGRPSVANALRLLELPDEVKQLLSAGMLSVGHAKVLLSLTDETQQILLARRCVTEGLTVRALERVIARKAEEKNEAQNRSLDIPESHIRYLLDRLHAKFNSPVRLQPSVTYANGKRAKGSIEIDFLDNEDLSRLLEILGVEVE